MAVGGAVSGGSRTQGGDSAGSSTVTSPCVDPLHFKINSDGGIEPQEWMQFRHVASSQRESAETFYSTVGGGDHDAQIHTLSVSWTNDTPIDQWVYGLVTRGGCRVTLQAASRGYLLTSHGVNDGGLYEVSRMGCGIQVGKEGLFANDAFAVYEVRQHASTVPLVPTWGGWERVEPGDSFSGQVEVKFVSENWQTASIEGGNTGGESSFVSGATRIDLFAIPVF